MPEVLRDTALSIRVICRTLNGCVVCRKAHEGDRLFFSSDRGGTVCRGCATGISGLVPVSPGTAASSRWPRALKKASSHV
ncbi:MAG: hypothetical protein HS130_12820 [Deltaproteobacteria bacterium]|nr:hypothetical protein [Deltaproteobacteria bacterium]